jgi:16S rRNA (cytidine1402-2'-O)-methyltransferase
MKRRGNMRQEAEKEGMLYLCATPIGNLEDITLRVLRILEEADYVVAEDTRHTLKLLNHFEISKPLISYHEHSGRSKAEEILCLVENGNKVALVSDAGMPGISDPGEELVRMAWERKVPITILPGATAGLSALVLSGISSRRFVFEGFLPREKRERVNILKKLREEDRTIVLYEAPHHLLETLKDLNKYLDNRKVAVVRELTKIHEQVLIFDLEDAIEYFTHTDPRGEFVVIVEGRSCEGAEKVFEEITIQEHIIRYMDAGLSKKEAVKMVAADRKMPKSEIYRYSIDIHPNESRQL